ncbi:MAG: hypothetical protein HC945_00940 [Nitrosarchaeum sp.]|nr:hypothetical protein [Nitrosarchaeum sp.]
MQGLGVPSGGFVVVEIPKIEVFEDEGDQVQVPKRKVVARAKGVPVASVRPVDGASRQVVLGLGAFVLWVALSFVVGAIMDGFGLVVASILFVLFPVWAGVTRRWYAFLGFFILPLVFLVIPLLLFLLVMFVFSWSW